MPKKQMQAPDAPVTESLPLGKIELGFIRTGEGVFIAGRRGNWTMVLPIYEDMTIGTRWANLSYADPWIEVDLIDPKELGIADPEVLLKSNGLI